MAHGRGLGEPIALVDLDAESITESFEHGLCEWLTARDCKSQRRETLRIRIPHKSERVVHRWNRDERSGLVLQRKVEQFPRHKLCRVDHFATNGKRHQCEHGQAEAVKLRQHTEHHIGGTESHPSANLAQIGLHIPHCEHHTLRFTARA